jgi:hypothetical protein
MANSEMIVTEIVDEGDRILIYGPDRPSDRLLGRYRVITSQEQALCLKAGDTIEYEPCGANFGWFVRRLNGVSSAQYR